MTTVPPFAYPSDHVIPIVVADFGTEFSIKSNGASGLVKIIAPLPTNEESEIP
jgi:hypothetical protein